MVYKLFGTNPLVARVILSPDRWDIPNHINLADRSPPLNRTVGLVAAAWNSLYIYFFYYAGALITETFYITAILWVFDLALRLTDLPPGTINWKQWLEFGLAISATVLLRQVFLLFLPFLYLWLWWNVKGPEFSQWQQRLRWSVVKGLFISTIVLVLLIFPWTIRNQKAFGTFVLLNTNSGFAFFWGNHPIYATRFIPLLPSQQSYYDLIPPIC